MIRISENIEEKSYSYKDWYKEMDTLVGEVFNSTDKFENSLSKGHKIHIDEEVPILPSEMTIPVNSNMKIEQLRGKTMEVLEISQTGDNKTILLGIRSTQISD